MAKRWRIKHRKFRTLAADIYFDRTAARLENTVKIDLPFSLASAINFANNSVAIRMESRHGCLGYYDYRQNVILIEPDQTDQNLWLTFLHELAHALTFHSGYICPFHSAHFIRTERALINQFLLTTT